MKHVKTNTILALATVLALGVAGCKGQKPTKLTTIPGVKTIVQNPTTTGPVGPQFPTQPPPGTTLPPTQPPTTTTFPPTTTQPPVVINPGPTVDPINFDFPSSFENTFADRRALFDLMLNFDYDSAAIRPADMPKIEQVARHLLQNPKFLLQVEGHCDERGTEQYNLSLGERRALAVTEQIIRMGISPNRIRTLSLGEEVPLVDAGSQDAYAQNRRGEFVLMVPQR